MLERTALDAISGLALSAAKYKEAVEILQKRFGNKSLIISKHVETLLAAEYVTSDQNLKDLRHLYDTTESHLRSLKSLGVNPASYGPKLSPVLLNKLPPELGLIVSRKTPPTGLNIENLLNSFEEELAARERASVSKPSYSQLPQNRERSRPQSSALLTRLQGTGPSCYYCQQEHTPVDCTVVTDICTRKQMLRSNGRCFNCLRKGHIGRSCLSTTRCQQFSGRHHSSICERADSQTSTSKELSKPHKTELNPAAIPYNPTPTTSTLCSDKGGTVFLQTACATVYNPSDPQRSMNVFDSGSQGSYITEQAKRHLALEPTRRQMLSIATFEASSEQTRVCVTVNVGLCLKGYPPFLLSLYVVPTICDPLASQPIAICIEKTHLLKGSDFADYSDGKSSSHVDILIGSDYYWELVTGSVCRSKKGPTAVHTKLGWVLSGPMLEGYRAQSSTNLITTHVLQVDTHQQKIVNLDEQLRSFWELESLGIQKVYMMNLLATLSSIKAVTR